MGKIFNVVLLFVFVIGMIGFVTRFVMADGKIALSPCERPIHYRIGTIDARFGVTEEDMVRYSKEAAAVWNSELGRELFVYDSEGELPIHLLYDERQTLSREIDNLENEIENKKNELDPQIQEYERLVATYEQKARSLNEEIQHWNSQGGAPPEEFDRIVTEQKALAAEADRLNALARELNLEANEYNVEVGKLNQTVETFNDALTVKPEQGLYIEDRGEKRIEIYFSNDIGELEHTLAHEMGHALGLDHVEDEIAIMHAMNSDIVTLSNADREELGRVCAQNYLAERFKRNWDYLISQISPREAVVPATGN